MVAFAADQGDGEDNQGDAEDAPARSAGLVRELPPNVGLMTLAKLAGEDGETNVFDTSGTGVPRNLTLLVRFLLLCMTTPRRAHLPSHADVCFATHVGIACVQTSVALVLAAGFQRGS